jgi:hypothetical protein
MGQTWRPNRHGIHTVPDTGQHQANAVPKTRSLRVHFASTLRPLRAGENAAMNLQRTSPIPPPEPPAGEDRAEYIPYEEFRNGLPHGRFRVVVNPALAAPFVAHHSRSKWVALALLGPGMACALSGYWAAGALLVGAAWLLRRVVKRQAPQILLHLATRLPDVYLQATEHGVMEVQRA